MPTRTARPKAGRTAADIMSSPLVSLNPDATLEEAAVALSENNISGAPVLDFDGTPVGVVSLFDIVSHLAGLKRPGEEPGGFYRYAYPKFKEGGEGWEGGWEETTLDETKALPIADAMTSDIISVPDRLALEDVVRMMWKRRIHRIFVEREGRLVGVISTMDLLRVMAGGRR